MSSEQAPIIFQFKHIPTHFYSFCDDSVGLSQIKVTAPTRIINRVISFYYFSTLNFEIPAVLIFQLEVYYKADRLLTGLTAQQIGTPVRCAGLVATYIALIP